MYSQGDPTTNWCSLRYCTGKYKTLLCFADDEVLIFLHATSALLIISLVIGAVGAILCVIGSHLDPRGSSGRTKFMGGMIAIAFGGKVAFSLCRVMIAFV